jgi:hypothetical protein
VVIHKVEKDKPGKIIGVSRILTPGLYSNTVIPINEAVVSGDMLVAMLHTENGDGVFSAETDVPTKGDDTMSSGMVEFVAL